MKRSASVKIPSINHRTWGVLLHPTSLPGPFYCGDIGKKAHDFLDFLKASGATWWQTLPTNPTDKAGSPYSTASSFAGEPLLIDLDDLVQRGLLSASDLRKPEASKPRNVNLVKARQFRLDVQRKAFKQAKETGNLLSSSKFTEFKKEQSHWLPNFALFTALTTKYKTCDWTSWPALVKNRDRKALLEAAKEQIDDIRFVEFQQFLFDEQWRSLKQKAEKLGIGLIGDIPIFVSHQSADVWSNQTIFCLNKSGKPDVVAGCPPDRFNADGQLWGNALYDWDALKKSKYDWWVLRFERLLEQFDLIRLDHFIGFYRYWAIPASAKTAATGKWRYTPGVDFFKTVIKRLGHLPLIAEDLGLVTEEVVQLREKFGFPGMRIVQFGFSAGADADHHKPHNYEPDSVVYTGTHDNETARGYMERIKKESESIHGAYTSKKRNPHNEFLTACTYLGVKPNQLKNSPDAMLRAAFSSVSNTAIIPMQDLLELPASHRMNVPGTSKGNWSWRCLESELAKSLSIELFAKAKIFGRT